MSLKNGLPRPNLIIALTLALMGVAVARHALAQSACGSYTCYAEWDFDSDAEAWKEETGVTGNASLDADWVASQTLGSIFQTSATGVATGNYGGATVLYKTFNLTAGHYQVLARVGSSAWTSIDALVTTSSGYSSTGVVGVWNEYKTTVFDEFDLTAPADVTIRFESGGDLYLDYVWIIGSLTPTATPAAGTPSATAVAASATPRATSTPYCVGSAATATPGFPAAGATVTPTPDPETNWSLYDNFNNTTIPDVNSGILWRSSGSGVRLVPDSGRGTSSAGAVYIPYSTGDFTGETTITRTALVHVFAGPVAGTVYVDGWGKPSYVPGGHTASVELWVQDAGDDAWSRWLTYTLSSGNWMPFHAAITSTGGVGAVAFVSYRTDTPGIGGNYLDDLYLYGTLSKSPPCGGWYDNGSASVPGWSPGNEGGWVAPGGGTIISGTSGLPGAGDSTYSDLTYPSNKPCPPAINVPNNFWGGILANLTIFVDGIFAFMPAHTPGALASSTEALIGSPLVSVSAIASVFFDLRFALAMFAFIVIGEAARGIWSVWIVIKKSIPFLN